MKLTELELAQLFHDTYEKLAPAFSYNTRTDTKVFNKDSANGKLMIAVCKVILQSFQPKSESRMYTEDEMRCSFDIGYDYRTSLNDDIIIEFGKHSAHTFESFLQSLQPKSESRMYTENEVFGFASWYKEMDGWEYLKNKSMKEVFEIYIQSLQPKTEERKQHIIDIMKADEEDGLYQEPKTEELKEGLKPCPNHPDVLISQCGICNGTFPKLEQPTYPSIDKMAELKKEFLYERHYYSGKSALWEFIEKVFQEGYKANNSLEELEKWIDDFPFLLSPDNVLAKIQELKTKQ